MNRLVQAGAHPQIAFAVTCACYRNFAEAETWGGLQQRPPGGINEGVSQVAAQSFLGRVSRRGGHDGRYDLAGLLRLALGSELALEVVELIGAPPLDPWLVERLREEADEDRRSMEAFERARRERDGDS